MKNLLEQLNKILVGGIVVLLALILGFIYWVFPANTQIPLWALCLALIVCVFVCILEYALLAEDKNTVNTYKLPDVKNISTKDENIVFITENSEILSIQSLVSIYVQDSDDFEKFIGIAYVETQNGKGFLQISLIKEFSTSDPSFFYDYKDNAKKLETIKIKPTVPKGFLKGEF